MSDDRSEHSKRSVMVFLAVTIFAVVGVTCFEVYGLTEQSKEASAHLELSKLTDGIEWYQRHEGRLPGSLQELVPEYVREVRPDPWGNAYVYSRTSETFEVRSAGPDHVSGTDDDVTRQRRPSGAPSR